MAWEEGRDDLPRPDRARLIRPCNTVGDRSWFVLTVCTQHTYPVVLPYGAHGGSRHTGRVRSPYKECNKGIECTPYYEYFDFCVSQ